VNSRAGIVLFGDVATSRRAAARSSRWLRTLAGELDSQYGSERLARFGFTQGDELQGLLGPEADPFAAILRAALHPDALRMRWAVAAGMVDPGSGPATQRTGAGFLAAREAINRARTQRDGLIVVTGDPPTDTLLADVAPLFVILLDELTNRQRVIARLMLVEELRQADVASRLTIKRPTVSVAVERARIREIGRLRHALLTLLREGTAAVAAARGVAS
jgi:DNA-binding CsgD family transcriptional regulator